MGNLYDSAPEHIQRDIVKDAIARVPNPQTHQERLGYVGHVQSAVRRISEERIFGPNEPPYGCKGR